MTLVEKVQLKWPGASARPVGLIRCLAGFDVDELDLVGANVKGGDGIVALADFAGDQFAFDQDSGAFGEMVVDDFRQTVPGGDAEPMSGCGGFAVGFE